MCIRDRRNPHTQRITIVSMAVCFAMAYIAEEDFGIADITGAYIAGIVLCTMVAEVVGRKEYLVCKIFDGGITLIFRILSLKVIIQQIFVSDRPGRLPLHGQGNTLYRMGGPRPLPADSSR